MSNRVYSYISDLHVHLILLGLFSRIKTTCSYTGVPDIEQVKYN